MSDIRDSLEGLRGDAIRKGSAQGSPSAEPDVVHSSLPEVESHPAEKPHTPKDTMQREQETKLTQKQPGARRRFNLPWLFRSRKRASRPTGVICCNLIGCNPLDCLLRQYSAQEKIYSIAKLDSFKTNIVAACSQNIYCVPVKDQVRNP